MPVGVTVGRLSVLLAIAALTLGHGLAGGPAHLPRQIGHDLDVSHQLDIDHVLDAGQEDPTESQSMDVRRDGTGHTSTSCDAITGGAYHPVPATVDCPVPASDQLRPITGPVNGMPSCPPPKPSLAHLCVLRI